MENFTSKTIREIAVEYPATTRIFEEFKIDYCCGGNRKFADACQSAGVPSHAVSQKLTEIFDTPNFQSDVPETKTVSELIDYILEKHHAFTKNEITRLSPLMEKVCRKHGDRHFELSALEKQFQLLCEDLLPHMRKEENVLFPFIKHLEMLEANNLSSPRPPFGTVKNPVSVMLREHDDAGDILRKMREVTANYAVPENSCPSFRALYFGLEELEKDLHRHIHLENNVLFPKAVELEQKVLFGY
ncbi:MAG TPA: iron-sulfur cluster repair di-iron protein [Pyrinomonadaceae bacterium]